MSQQPNFETANNRALAYTPTLKERVVRRLFPYRPCGFPDLQRAQRDGIIARFTIELSVIDRLRALVTGRILIQANTCTENVIGENKTEATCTVLPPRLLEGR